MGFVFRLNTPIIRVFSKKNPKEFLSFYSKEQYHLWERARNDSHIDINTRYNIRYYKGLAGHYGPLVTDIFKRYRENHISYVLDTMSSTKFEAYFGQDVSLRKIELQITTPYRDIYYHPQGKHSISVTDHMDIETKSFQLENIERKLPHCIDGLMITRRKILYVSMLYWSNHSAELKVFQLGGEVARKTYYHHGEAALQGTIICMA